MPSMKIDFPPVYLPNAAGNLLNCNITSESGPVGFSLSEPYLIVRHVRVINIDTVAHVISLYKGGTGGSTSGTQFAWGNYSLAAQAYDDWYGEERFNAADFLSGIADLASKVIININADLVFP
jgi:hypothetical protein